MVDRYIQRKPQVTTRTVIGSRHDLLTITAGTVIRLCTVILHCDIDWIRFDAHFFVSAQLTDSYY